MIHNLLVRMTESGAFEEEVAAEGGKFNTATQFLDEETARLVERGEQVSILE